MWSREKNNKETGEGGSGIFQMQRKGAQVQGMPLQEKREKKTKKGKGNVCDNATKGAAN